MQSGMDFCEKEGGEPEKYGQNGGFRGGQNSFGGGSHVGKPCIKSCSKGENGSSEEAGEDGRSEGQTCVRQAGGDLHEDAETGKSDGEPAHGSAPDTSHGCTGGRALGEFEHEGKERGKRRA